MADVIIEFNEYFNDEDKKRLARLLMLSRAESGLSQEKIALELGIAKKTVQNWERGISAPSLPQAIGWFRAMGVSAMPYFLQFMFPEMEGVKSKDDDQTIKADLMQLIDNLPIDGIRQLMYLFYGNHGSSPRGIMNMITAHLQTPLRDRLNHAGIILEDYKLAKEMGELSKPEHVQPNIDLLEQSIIQCREAVIENHNAYTLLADKHMAN